MPRLLGLCIWHTEALGNVTLHFFPNEEFRDSGVYLCGGTESTDPRERRCQPSAGCTHPFLSTLEVKAGGLQRSSNFRSVTQRVQGQPELLETVSTATGKGPCAHHTF